MTEKKNNEFTILRSADLWTLPDTLSKEFNVVQAEIKIEEVVAGQIQMIDFSWNLFAQVSGLITSAEALVHKINWADSALFLNKQMKPFLLSEKAFINLVKSKKVSIQRSMSACIVGDRSTFASFVNVLQKFGMTDFIFVCEPFDGVASFIDNLQKLFLGIKIHNYSFEDYFKIEKTCSIMIVDLDCEKEKDLIQSISYFNFLDSKAYFLDIRSAFSSVLQSEAERADLTILDGVAFIKGRYELAKILCQ